MIKMMKTKAMMKINKHPNKQHQRQLQMMVVVVIVVVVMVVVAVVVGCRSLVVGRWLLVVCR